MRRGKEEHERALSEYVMSCENKIIDLKGKSPDAIEAYVEDGKIKLRAIEVLPLRWDLKNKRWKKTFTMKGKEYSYRMFDEVKFVTYLLEYSKK